MEKKKVVSVSVRPDVWANVKELAWRQKKSASQYLEDMICTVFKNEGHEVVESNIPDEEILRKAQEKLDARLARADVERMQREDRERKTEDVRQVFFNPQPKGKK